MEQENLTITVEDFNQGAAGAAAESLADRLREIDGVTETYRSKADPATLDLGAIVQVVATSGATVAIAQGIAGWLRARRGVTIRIVRNPGQGSIKAMVHGVDPATAVRIVELVRSA